jgi:hypothetical protein
VWSFKKTFLGCVTDSRFKQRNMQLTESPITKKKHSYAADFGKELSFPFGHARKASPWLRLRFGLFRELARMRGRARAMREAFGAVARRCSFMMTDATAAPPRFVHP